MQQRPQLKGNRQQLNAVHVQTRNRDCTPFLLFNLDSINFYLNCHDSTLPLLAILTVKLGSITFQHQLLHELCCSACLLVYHPLLVTSNVYNDDRRQFRWTSFQSILDFAVSSMLFIDSVTVGDTYLIHHKGILGELECRLWNSQLLLWGFFLSSTWNLVTLTFERFGILFIFGVLHN